MRVSCLLLISAGIAVSVSGRVTAAEEQKPTAAMFAAGLGKDPFGKLFAPQQPVRIADSQRNRDDGRLKPKIVCGMVMIPADPSIDPGIRAKIPQTDVRYTIRAIPPPVCQPE